MTSTEQLLAILVVLLTLSQLIVLVLGVAVLLQVKRLMKRVDGLLESSQKLVLAAQNRVVSGRSSIATAMWLLKKVKQRRSSI